ncbi:N-acetyltransferase [Prunus dulcis]|uniref:N-acetyltransferase n=1 Tax=Prunus dulcis TaxID=3755 RepID=A0A4Y1RTY7_PRUDU|nr:N-acetyltransferase [Prunus dulcis]
MAPRKTATPSSTRSPIPIGNCEVTVEAGNFSCQSDPNTLQISVSRSAKISISVRKEMERNNDSIAAYETFLVGNPSFVVVNPKDADSCQKSYLQEVLKMYIRELPAMNFAANTGKQSMKYCTLLLKSRSVGDSEEVIAAITYQIVPADTQYAEIPLAAVSSIYQHKGFGSCLFMELRKRLQSVGICTIFCWGDKDSEGFWLKQGFVSIAEVDTKGKCRRIPIKADIRRALCFPGGSTLMVLHLNQDVSSNTAESLKLGILLKPNGKSSTASENQLPGFSKGNYTTLNTENQMSLRSENCQPENLVNGLPREDKGSQCRETMQCIRDPVHLFREDSSKFVSAAEVFTSGVDADVRHCSCSKQVSCAKRKVWKASMSSLKSKKVKGSHQVGCQSESNFSLVSETDGSDSCLRGCSFVSYKDKPLVADPPRDLLGSSYKEKNAEECGPVNITSETLVRKEFQTQREFFKIMLMNIADDTKKANLTKVIEDLGGLLRLMEAQAHMLSRGNSQSKSKSQGLLKGYDVCIAAHVQPTARMLSSIVRSAGGNIISELEKVNEASKTIFVACEEDMEEVLLAVKKGYGHLAVIGL